MSFISLSLSERERSLVSPETAEASVRPQSVSYTHLTLPTILRV